jgi:hypothetical protein
MSDSTPVVELRATIDSYFKALIVEEFLCCIMLTVFAHALRAHKEIGIYSVILVQAICMYT